MAASKLEIPISQRVHKKELNSNGYTYVFGVQLSNGTIVNVVRPNGKKPELENPRWRPVNLQYIYLSLNVFDDAP